MINHKKKILIKKHLGENTPEWIINNCISMLNEYEEVELDGYTKAKNNEGLDLVSVSDLVIQRRQWLIDYVFCCEENELNDIEVDGLDDRLEREKEVFEWLHSR